MNPVYIVISYANIFSGILYLQLSHLLFSFDFLEWEIIYTGVRENPEYN